MQKALSPILLTARDILKQGKSMQGMHVDEIAAAAVSTNQNMGMPLDEFSKKLQAALASNLKLKTQKPTFARIEGKKKGSFKRGWYRLKQERVQSASANIEPPEVTTGFIGRAGEYAVMGELLFWGYNVSLMAVDHGVDIVANKDNRYFNVQVKTATEQDGRKFLFTIKRQAFQANDNNSMYYVFAMRGKLSNTYAILPNSFMQALLGAGAIGSGPNLSITIASDDKSRRFTLNGNTEINLYINNFGVIR